MKICKDVDTYIASAAEDARPKLVELRELIRTTIPDAEEKIWYGVPFYHVDGEVAGFSALKNHISFGIGSDAFDTKSNSKLVENGYEVGKGTIQIKFDQKVPTEILKHLLLTKVKMNQIKVSTKS